MITIASSRPFAERKFESASSAKLQLQKLANGEVGTTQKTVAPSVPCTPAVMQPRPSRAAKNLPKPIDRADVIHTRLKPLLDDAPYEPFPEPLPERAYSEQTHGDDADEDIPATPEFEDDDEFEVIKGDEVSDGDKVVEEDEGEVIAEDEDEIVDVFVQSWKLDEVSAELLCRLFDEDRKRIMGEFKGSENAANVNDVFQTLITSEYLSDDRYSVKDHVLNAMKKWNLNLEALEKLRELPQAAQEEVVERFNPPIGLANYNQRFMVFLKFRSRSHDPSDRYNEFITHWGLNDDASRMLLELDIGLAEELMMEFCPKEDRGDPSNLFMSFVRSRVPTYKARFIDPLQEFISLWDLNSEASTFLRAMEADIAREVMSQFDAKGLPRSRASKLFLSFAKSRQETHHKIADAYDDFIKYWTLNKEASEFLHSLEADLADEVMTDFTPKHVHNDVNNLFLTFARDRQRTYNSQFNNKEFINRWCLNSTSVKLFKGCDSAMQDHIISNFTPPADLQAAGINGRFQKFVQTLLIDGIAPRRPCRLFLEGRCNKGDSCPMTHEVLYASISEVPCRYFGRGFCKNGSACKFYHAGEQKIFMENGAVEAFQQRLGLDNDSIARLRTLPEGLQVDIIKTFQPRGEKHLKYSINAKFITYLRSRKDVRQIWGDEENTQPWKRHRWY